MCQILLVEQLFCVYRLARGTESRSSLRSLPTRTLGFLAPQNLVKGYIAHKAKFLVMASTIEKAFPKISLVT